MIKMVKPENATHMVFIMIILFQSFPRSIWLSDNKKQLVQWPVEEIEKLRGKKVNIANHELKGGTRIEVPNITASQVCKIGSILCCYIVF